MKTKPKDPEPTSFWNHLEELRGRLLKVALICATSILVTLFFMPNLSGFLQSQLPLNQDTRDLLKTEKLEKFRTTNLSHIAQNFVDPEDQRLIPLQPGEFIEYWASEKNKLILLSPTEGMGTTLKLAFWTGIVASSPLWLYQIFLFLSPALKRDERLQILPFLLFSLFFLSLGLFFCAQVTLPLANHYLSSFNQSLGTNLWSYSHYIDYTLLLFLGNAFAFECAAILLCLVHCGLCSASFMRQKRRHAVLLFLILGALLTPPDVLTQLCLAIPLMLFYEAAILYASLMHKKREGEGLILQD